MTASASCCSHCCYPWRPAQELRTKGPLLIGGKFLLSAVGGGLLGLALGYGAFLMMRGVDDYNVELIISLALSDRNLQPCRDIERVGSGGGRGRWYPDRQSRDAIRDERANPRTPKNLLAVG